LANLVDTIEEADLKMTTTLQDKMIAFKARGGRLTSSIEHTKGNSGKKSKHAKRDEGGAALSSAAMFPNSNQSPIDQIRPQKRQRQAHPGNNGHIHWKKLKLCEFCNLGVQSKVLQCRCVYKPSPVCRVEQAPKVIKEMCNTTKQRSPLCSL
jgi:hypothetical protein